MWLWVNTISNSSKTIKLVVWTSLSNSFVRLSIRSGSLTLVSFSSSTNVICFERKSKKYRSLFNFPNTKVLQFNSIQFNFWIRLEISKIFRSKNWKFSHWWNEMKYLLGDPHDYDKTIEYIRDKFVSLNPNPKKQIYYHVTCATDTNNVRVVFDAVRDTVLHKALRDSGLGVWSSDLCALTLKRREEKNQLFSCRCINTLCCISSMTLCFIHILYKKSKSNSPFKTKNASISNNFEKNTISFFLYKMSQHHKQNVTMEKTSHTITLSQQTLTSILLWPFYTLTNASVVFGRICLVQLCSNRIGWTIYIWICQQRLQKPNKNETQSNKQKMNR